MDHKSHRRDGVALAAAFAAGLGCVTIGLMTVLAEASLAAKAWLTWCPPAGPLSGKTGMGVLVWLGSWLILHNRWQHWELAARKIWLWSLLLIALGWLGTFPPFFTLFAVGH